MGPELRIQSFVCQRDAMKLLLLLLACLILAALLPGLGEARPSEVDSPGPDANDLDTGNGEEAVTKPLGTFSIKVRHVLADPLLCQQLSRYHPHHPQCHGYCKRQGHWIGQCKANSCHCFS